MTVKGYLMHYALHNLGKYRIPMKTSSCILHFFFVTVRQHGEVTGVHPLCTDRFLQQYPRELADAIEYSELLLWKSICSPGVQYGGQFWAVGLCKQPVKICVEPT